MKTIPYRSASFYHREIANTGDLPEIKKTLLELIAEREKTRAWIRERGLVPPVFNVPEKKAKEIIEKPLTDWQKSVAARFR